MPKRFAILVALLAVPAAADDQPPADVDVPSSDIDDNATSTSDAGTSTFPATTTTTTTRPDGSTTTTTTTSVGAPGIAPVAPVAVAPDQSQWGVESDDCYRHGKWGRWRERMRGRVSIGFSASHMRFREDDTEGKQKSFVLRLNGRRGWSIEGELSKLRFDENEDVVAKTGGLSLVKTFGKRKLAPYVLAGGGGGRYEYADGTEQKVHFAEAGGGVMYRGRRFSIGVDVRKGVRKFKTDESMTSERMSTSEPEEDRDHYTRGRVLALINF
jgi:hypothetical protein